MKAIYILWLRQLRRYFRSRSRMLGTLGQPIMFLLALGFGFAPTFQKAGQGNYLEFLTPGIISMAVLFTAVFSGIEIIWDRQFGFLKETLIAPVSRFYIVLGRTLGGATVASIQGVIVFVICILLGFRFENTAFLPVALAFLFLIALLFASVGTAIASVLQDMQGFQLIMNFCLLPIFFFSNALFPVRGLPKVLRLFIHMNPLSYGVDGLRGSLDHRFVFGVGADFVVLGLFTVLFLAIGSILFSKIQL